VEDLGKDECQRDAGKEHCSSSTLGAEVVLLDKGDEHLDAHSVGKQTLRGKEAWQLLVLFSM